MVMKKSLAPRSFLDLRSLSEGGSEVGFSLVEVLVFTAILGLFFVGALSVTTFNLKNMKIQEHKILATRYAEEGVEWLKQQKEDDWSIFSTRGSIGGKTYCLNNSPLGWGSSLACVSYGLSTIYKRELVIKNFGSPVDRVKTTVTVYWQDMGTNLKVEIITIFKLLE